MAQNSSKDMFMDNNVHTRIYGSNFSHVFSPALGTPLQFAHHNACNLGTFCQNL